MQKNISDKKETAHIDRKHQYNIDPICQMQRNIIAARRQKRLIDKGIQQWKDKWGPDHKKRRHPLSVLREELPDRRNQIEIEHTHRYERNTCKNWFQNKKRVAWKICPEPGKQLRNRIPDFQIQILIPSRKENERRQNTDNEGSIGADKSFAQINWEGVTGKESVRYPSRVKIVLKNLEIPIIVAAKIAAKMAYT